MMKSFSNNIPNYIIDYIGKGKYGLLHKQNNRNNSISILATSDSPARLLEIGYFDLKIQDMIDVSEMTNVIMELEMIEKFNDIAIHNDFIKIIDKMIQKLSLNNEGDEDLED